MDYNFGTCTFSDERFALHCEGREISLRPKAVDLVATLVSNPGRVLTKDELLDKVWPDVEVGEDSLSQCVHEIRTAIGPKNADLLRTVRGRGYMLDADVTTSGAKPESQTRPTRTDLRRLPILITAGMAAGVTLVAAISWLSASEPATKAVDPITEFGLLFTETTVLGDDFSYPGGIPQINSVILTLQPGFESRWHVNTVPTFVYMLEGAIEVEYSNGRIHRATKGDAFIEGIEIPHFARTSGLLPARMLVLDMGVRDRHGREFFDAPDEFIASDHSATQ